LNTDISQGSVVTRLKCGGIIDEDLVANKICQWKNFEYQSTFGEVLGNVI